MEYNYIPDRFACGVYVKELFISVALDGVYSRAAFN